MTVTKTHRVSRERLDPGRLTKLREHRMGDEAAEKIRRALARLKPPPAPPQQRTVSDDPFADAWEGR